MWSVSNEIGSKTIFKANGCHMYEYKNSSADEFENTSRHKYGKSSQMKLKYVNQVENIVAKDKFFNLPQCFQKSSAFWKGFREMGMGNDNIILN